MITSQSKRLHCGRARPALIMCRYHALEHRLVPGSLDTVQARCCSDTLNFLVNVDINRNYFSLPQRSFLLGTKIAYSL
eukprot:4422241-Pleurochrysis_carterae.AAC.1